MINKKVQRHTVAVVLPQQFVASGCCVASASMAAVDVADELTGRSCTAVCAAVCTAAVVAADFRHAGVDSDERF